MNINLTDVVWHITSYFEKHLPQYTVLEIRRQTFNPYDDYLYMVAAKHQNGDYAVWTSWNEQIQSLNHGHYNLSDMKICAKIMTEYQNAYSAYNDDSNSPTEVFL